MVVGEVTALKHSANGCLYVCTPGVSPPRETTAWCDACAAQSLEADADLIEGDWLDLRGKRTAVDQSEDLPNVLLSAVRRAQELHLLEDKGVGTGSSLNRTVVNAGDSIPGQVRPRSLDGPNLIRCIVLDSTERDRTRLTSLDDAEGIRHFAWNPDRKTAANYRGIAAFLAISTWNLQ